MADRARLACAISTFAAFERRDWRPAPFGPVDAPQGTRSHHRVAVHAGRHPDAGQRERRRARRACTTVPTCGCAIPLRPGLRSLNVALGRGDRAGARRCARPAELPDERRHERRRPAAAAARALGSSSCATGSAPRSSGSRTTMPGPPTPTCRPAGSSGSRLGPAGRRRRRDGDHARPRVREGRRQRLDGVGRVQPRVPRARCPGAEEDGRFWASGISLVAHLRSPHVPPAHMNTRHIRTSQDLVRRRRRPQPDLSRRRRTRAAFHAALQAACDATRPTPTSASSSWADEYFFLPHRGEPRGVGGIFYDYLEGDFERDLAFTHGVGEAFLDVYPKLVRRHMDRPWTEAERAAPAGAPRPLRRVQPALRPRHPVRPEDRRQHRGDPDVAAAGRRLALSPSQPHQGAKPWTSTGCRPARTRPTRSTSYRGAAALGSDQVRVRQGDRLHLRRSLSLHDDVLSLQLRLHPATRWAVTAIRSTSWSSGACR